MIIFSIISIFLEGIVNLFLSQNSLLFPLFNILSLIIIYLNIEKKGQIYNYALIQGLICDIAFTQTLFMNTLLFLLISLIISKYYKYVPYHIISTLTLSIIVITLYRTITYFLYVIFNEVNFNFLELFKSIYSSLILNITYLVISYFIFKKFKKKTIYGYLYR